MRGTPKLQDLKKLKEKYPAYLREVEYDNGLVLYSYLVANNEMFSEPFGRETRGVVFDKETGEIVSRPFHKFFNYHEMPLPDYKNTLAALKEDGSLLQASIYKEELILGSRNTLSRDGTVLRIYHSRLPENRKEQLEDLVRRYPDYTHLFELVDTKHKIVLDYDHTDIIYLISRHKISGEYKVITDHQIPMVYWEALEDFDSFRQKVKDMEGIEGYVVWSPLYNDFTKLKTKWYLERHKVHDTTLTELWVNDELDDLIGYYEKTRYFDFVNKARAFIKAVDSYLRELIGSPCVGLAKANKELGIKNRKEYVFMLQDCLKKVDKNVRGILFSSAMEALSSGQDLESLIVGRFKREAAKSRTTWAKEKLREIEREVVKNEQT